MPKRLSVRLPVLLLALVLAPLAVADEDWIERSNENAQWLLREQARFSPESAGQNGLDGVDEEITDLAPGRSERLIEANEAQIAELHRRLAEERDPRVRQDLEILLASVDRNLRGTRLNHELTVPYFNLPQMMYFGIAGLLNPQIPEERHPAALMRLRRYAGQEAGYAPATAQARALIKARSEESGLIWPYRPQVESDLTNSGHFMGGIRQLFESLSIEGYEPALAALEAQVAGYNDFVRSEILPHARADFVLPPELYALALERWGVESTPDALIRDATAAFASIRNEMAALAPLVAAEREWDTTDYREVIRLLKKDRFDADSILRTYRETNAALEEIIRREDIVSLPPREVAIRMKTPAEEAALPAPSLQTPRLVGNTGEVVEFLLPAGRNSEGGAHGGGHGGGDDMVFKATAWTLAAHEMRPGHELQFSTMLESGVSDTRALFAFNSVNVEGWALYAEAEMKPYFPLEGQLIGLQHRMMRAARAFLDPMLNTGQISIADARRVLTDEIVLSPSMAETEIERYTFRMPGQATAYFYGYKQLMALRVRTELVLGEAFDRREFHDFILAQGLLPPPLLERAVTEEFIPSRTVVLSNNTL